MSFFFECIASRLFDVLEHEVVNLKKIQHSSDCNLELLDGVTPFANDLKFYIPCLSHQHSQSLNSSNNKLHLYNILNSPFLNEYSRLCNKYREVDWNIIEKDFITFLTNQQILNNNNNITINFENSDSQNRVSMVLKEIFGLYSTTNYPSSILFCNDVYFTEISFILSFCLMQMPCFLFPSNISQYHHSIIQAAISRRKNLQNEDHLTWLFKDLIKFLFSLQLPSYFGDDQSSNRIQHCFSEKYIISIMLNHPYIIEEVIEFLIREFSSQNHYLTRLESILKQVSLFSRPIAEKVRFYCMKFKKFSDLCLGITFDCVNDYCSFFNNCFNVVLESGTSNVFTDSKPSEYCLFDCIKQNQKIQTIMRELIIRELQREDLSVSETCSLMRLCSALILLSNFNVFKNDFSVVINTNPAIPVSIHLTKLRFSFLFICGENLTASLSSDLMVVDNSSNSNIVSVLREFIKFLMDVANSMHTEGGTPHLDKVIIKNILLLLATNFHAELYKSISSFVLDTLHPSFRNTKHGGHGSFNANPYNQGSQSVGEPIVHSHKPSRYLLDENTLKRQLGDKIALLFVSELFPVEKLAKDILTVTPLPFYTSDNDYVLQCVFRMLKSKLFRKHSVDASDWVFEQLENIQSVDNPRSTLHHLIPKIIDELISNCTPHPTIIFEMKLFKEEKISKIFENPESNQVSIALLLYYILSVNNVFKKQRYGPNIIEKCNVVEVVKYIKEHRRQVKVFYSQLLSVVEELQYLFHLETLLSESVIHYETSGNVHISSSVIEEIILTPMTDQNKTKMALDDLRYDKQLSQKLEEQILFMLDVSNQNGLFYNFQNVRHFVFNAFQEWWKWMFSKTNPMSLALKTAQVLLPKEFNPSQLNYINFYENILILFKVDQRVFMCPPLLDIFLQVLSLFMTASSKYVAQVVPNEAVLKDSFSKVQESTILQLLLEYLNPNLFSKDNSPIHEDNGSTDMRIIQRKICQFIHQRFIENPPISKLIHFQTYNPALLPITVSLIDSIHICMDFINELLNQPKINQQMFAVQLASFICEKYPLQRYIDVARSAIVKLKFIANQRSAIIATNSVPEGSIDLFSNKHSANQQEELSNAKEILDTLLRLSRAFPFLCLECIQVVHELKTVFAGKPKVLNLVQQYFVKLTNTSANI